MMLLVSVVVVITIVTWCSIVIDAQCDNNDYGRSLSCPGRSCFDINHKNPNTHGQSGSYVIKKGASLSIVYCDMKLRCGGVGHGWMRVAFTNTTNGDSCPSGWQRITSPVAACRPVSDSAGCYSAHFNTHHIPYSRVCGMVVGYQKGSTNGFASIRSSKSINGPYLDGVSITYGLPRKHIWSFGAGQSSDSDQLPNFYCPCAKHPGPLPPSFARDHFYCESGNTGTRSYTTYYTSDPLWDGRGCSSENSCCSQPNQPWFYRQLPLTSSDSIEVRICYDEIFSNEGVLVKELQLYVK